MNRVAIIGATGVVGRGLLESCIVHQTECYVLVRKDSHRRSQIPENSLIHLVDCDLNEMQTLNVEGLPKMDAFFFLAWQGTFGADVRNDFPTQIKNIGYAIDAVHLAKRLGCETFVGVGSQAEYGRVEGIIHADTPCNPENGYGMAKLCAGQMTRIECQKNGLRYEWARIFSVYGPCDGENTMVSYAIQSCLNGEQPGFTKAEQKWDYLYSEDAGEALYQIAEHGVDGKVYPLGSGKSRPLREYIEILCKMTNPDIIPEFGRIPYANKQVMYLQADITELTRDTGFVPKYSFEEGIQKTIEWEKHNRHV